MRFATNRLNSAGPRLAARGFLLFALIVLVGCSSGGSSRHVAVAVSPVFNQLDLEGTWSGSILGEGGFTTIVLDVDFDGFVLYGLESDFDEVTFGELVLVDSFFGDVELFYETSDGEILTGFGSLSPNLRRINITFTKSNGDFGDIILKRGFGPGTFFPEHLAGDYDVELVDPLFPLPRTGFILVDQNGFVFDGAIDGVPIASGNVTIVDDFLGIYKMNLFLADGEVILIDGVISLADGILGGLYDDDFTAGGFATLFPT